jgi:hypothetical protein
MGYWPPARRAYAPEGMMECWNNGRMGSKAFLIMKIDFLPILNPIFYYSNTPYASIASKFG